MRVIISSVLLISTLLAGCADETRSVPKGLECGFDDVPASPDECECAGGTARYGIGPAAECADGEEQLSELTEFPGDAIPIEGAVCCVPRP